MKVLVTKANDDYWHKVVDVKTIEDVMKLYHRVIIEKNYYTSADEILAYWEGVNDRAEAYEMANCKYEVTIYNGYVE